MTPQERELVADLFDRLATLEREPRDREAERVIRDGVSRAPNAVYALVQSVLVQDEALKQADARIRELEAELYGPAESSREPGSFLDNMREALLGGGRAQASGSVPTVHPQGRPMGAPPQSGQPQSEAMAGRGGSFLGTAGAAAAGMIGGGLLLEGIRAMLGGQNQGPFAGTFDRIAGGRSPWGSEAAAGDLARSAGIDDVGAGRAADSNERYTGLFDPAADRISLDDSDEASDPDDGSDDMDDGGEDV